MEILTIKRAPGPYEGDIFVQVSHVQGAKAYSQTVITRTFCDDEDDKSRKPKKEEKVVHRIKLHMRKGKFIIGEFGSLERCNEIISEIVKALTERKEVYIVPEQ